MQIHRAPQERWEVVEIPIRHVDGTVRTLLWNSATLDGQGNVIIRHLFIQKIGMVMSPSTGQSWPINQGAAWQGDVSPVNAGLVTV